MPRSVVTRSSTRSILLTQGSPRPIDGLPTGASAVSTRRPQKSLIVQKYGGSSLARPEQIREVASRISSLHAAGHSLIIVVSAMGRTTDQLVELAYRVSPTPNRRELDMLLTTGERVSMALVSMALNHNGCPAISFTGSQAGVLTDDLHSNARIIDVKPIRVEAEIAANHVVVLAGFQGVSPKTKEITTLGRGGSDTTAVAMAAAFHAERCEIRKDVDGVYSADPNSVENTQHLSRLDYESLLDMTYWGAKVLHYRSVELAALLQMPMMIALASGDGRSTWIGPKSQNEGSPMFEEARILSVNSHKDVRWISIHKPTMAAALQELSGVLKKADLPLPQFLDSDVSAAHCRILVTAPTETLEAITRLNAPNVKVETATLSSVTATCQGAFASPLPGTIAQELERHSVHLHKLIFGAMSLTAVVDASHRDEAVKVIHGLRDAGTLS